MKKAIIPILKTAIISVRLGNHNFLLQQIFYIVVCKHLEILTQHPPQWYPAGLMFNKIKA